MPRELTVRATRVHNGIWLLASTAIPDRTGAEGLRGTRLLVDTDDVADDADEDAWYEDELVGLTRRRPSRRPARHGERARARPGPGPARASGCPTGGRRYVPFVAAIVPEVDVEGGRVVLDPPPGLLELNAD